MRYPNKEKRTKGSKFAYENLILRTDNKKLFKFYF